MGYPTLWEYFLSELPGIKSCEHGPPLESRIPVATPMGGQDFCFNYSGVGSEDMLLKMACSYFEGEGFAIACRPNALYVKQSGILKKVVVLSFVLNHACVFVQPI